MSRPTLALLLLALFHSVAFGLRTWQHLRATGTTGFHGISGRPGVLATERTRLVVRGPFAVVRNPIFTCMLLTAFGLAVLLPNVLAWAALACLFVAVELQVRLVEEPHLARLHGQAYRDYSARVGRFVPGLGTRG